MEVTFYEKNTEPLHSITKCFAGKKYFVHSIFMENNLKFEFKKIFSDKDPNYDSQMTE